MPLPLRRPSRDPVRPAFALPRDPSGRLRWTGRRAAALGLAALATLGMAAPPSLGPQGLGDRLFPLLGNTGYDVTSYDISLDYSGHNDRPLNATTVITARATTELDHVNLDFARGTVRSVEIGGLPAAHQQHGEDLVLTPAFHISAGQEVKIAIEHTSEPRGKGDGGWLRTSDGLAMANQADAAHRVFPCNDHPSDKALFTFHITAPQELTAVANGLPLSPGARAGRRTWTYRTTHPMATELAQVSIGRSSVVLRHGPHGLPVRDVVPTAHRRALAPWLAKTPAQIAWMERKVGPFPFEAYGVLIASARTGFELETQTLSLFEKAMFTTDRLPAWYVESVMLHELAHQWFGDSVSPRRWSDVWLNEAHATWYEALYAQERSNGRATLEARMRHAYQESDGWRAEGGPPAVPKAPSQGQKIGIFRPIVYDGSALVLYALRQKIGAAAFDRLERAWVERHRDGVADTADFVQLSSQVAGQDLTGFFQDWLYGDRTPPMPGHPEWLHKGPAAKPRHPKAVAKVGHPKGAGAGLGPKGAAAGPGPKAAAAGPAPTGAASKAPAPRGAAAHPGKPA
ncbi:M1 family metallopeptidase [Streptomyces lydicus]|uniref:M1 family metallopeptidase n=1 Tax=Streptomyces lydicus TaxID=47763 RepID=UPI0010139502|nr:M1 family metallopeptidase [Streptomyces lydicus]